ncbi:MAG: 50S ribosomal protein L25 [Chloroflexi bacterium]|mgnify:CR=1 FL=1|nr:50S ribosomal protein L25 [Chloroflexota bacterium]
MEKNVINARKRDIKGKKPGVLRREGEIPGVLYGHKSEPTPIVLNAKELNRALMGLTSSSIVTLNVEGTEHSALIREKQRDYLRNQIIHIDFQVLALDEKIRTRIEIALSGVAPAVKEFSGVVLTEKEYIEVEALPKDLPERIVVNLDSLKEIGDIIRIKDLEFSEKVTVLDDLEDVIVSVSSSSPVEEPEEEVVEDEAVDIASEPEVIEKGKKEQEESED